MIFLLFVKLRYIHISRQYITVKVFKNRSSFLKTAFHKYLRGPFLNTLTHKLLCKRSVHWNVWLTHFSLCYISYRNQSFYLHCKSNDWFLYEMRQWAVMGETGKAVSQLTSPKFWEPLTLSSVLQTFWQGTAHKLKSSVKDFFSKCDQIRSVESVQIQSFCWSVFSCIPIQSTDQKNLHIWLLFTQWSLMENLIFGRLVPVRSSFKKK